ncbi:uncharacterized protein LOC143470411 isoform X1 [Clavelina lepadiformis]|uniref:uncharacterized protein LOC143470411 isoform X1 n=1 Tax=Clavelina lepadiformis TaxID=159417 RepID=UPI0040417CD3
MDTDDQWNFKATSCNEFEENFNLTVACAPSSGIYYSAQSPPTNDIISMTYGPEEQAKLDEVLENVNQLIECLNNELADDASHQDAVSRATHIKANRQNHVTGSTIKCDVINTRSRGDRWGTGAGKHRRRRDMRGGLGGDVSRESAGKDNKVEEFSSDQDEEISPRKMKENDDTNSNLLDQQPVTQSSTIGPPESNKVLSKIVSISFNEGQLFKSGVTESTELKELKNSQQSSSFVEQAQSQDTEIKENSKTFKSPQPAEEIRPSKEKQKVHLSLSLPAKVGQLENQVLKAILPKRKTSRGKGPELSELSVNGSSFSCFSPVHEERKSSSAFTAGPSQSSSKKTSKKIIKSPSTSGRKNFLSRQKKFGSYFRRAQSFEHRRSSTHDQEEDQEQGKLHSGRKVKVLPLAESVEESNLSSELGSGRNHPTKSTDSPRRNITPKLARQPKISEDSSAKILRVNSSTTFGRVASEESAPQEKTLRRKISEVLPSSRNEFSLPEAGSRRRRATMDSAPGRVAYLSRKQQPEASQQFWKWSKPGHEGDTSGFFPEASSKWNAKSTNRVRAAVREAYSLAQTWVEMDSDNSTRGSQDSLDEPEEARSPFSPSRRGKSADYQGIDGARSSKKEKKNKLRKTLKSVGKSPSLPVYDADEMAERTWSPDGNCSWSNMSGRRVELGSTRLLSLSELECDALQKVSVQRLNNLDLGVAIVAPKDESKVLNRKISMKKKYGVTLTLRDKNKEKGADHVFGIPLLNVVENDQLLRLQKSASFAASLDYSSTKEIAANQEMTSQTANKASSETSSCTGSCSSINNHHGNEQMRVRRPLVRSSSAESINVDYTSSSRMTEGDNVFSPTLPLEHGQHGSPGSAPTSAASTAARPLKRRGAIAADSINEIDPYQSQLLEALSLSVSGTTHSQRREKKRSLLPPTMAQVPYVVQKCCDHITKYGLAVTGIFRIAGSRKRVKQLREEFDLGVDVSIDEDYNPHDVAALLKEFFRDLPEALLTRELYPAFIQTSKLAKSERMSSLRSLIWLLPLTNRDTLLTLLNFLALVASHADVTTDDAGNKVQGNKMGTANLATIFGPNILHRHKKSTQSSNENQYQVQSLEKAEDSSAVIKVVEDLINNQTQLFQIPKDEHDQMLRVLKETDPEAVDFLLRRKAANHMREKSKLLTNNSATPPASRKSNQRHTSDIHPSQTDGVKINGHHDSTSDESVNTPNEEERVHSSMRLSYQQATGHLPFMEGRRDKAAKLKFKPLLKKIYQSNTDSSDLDEKYESANSSGLDETSDDVLNEDSLQATNDNDVTKDKRRVSTSSMFSLSHVQDRSMSFTDDDLQEILGPNTEEANDCDVSNSNRSNWKSRETSFENSFRDLRNNDVTLDEVQATNSSDSGVSLDFSKKLDNSFPDFVKRRGGFSLALQGAASGASTDDASSETTEATVIEATPSHEVWPEKHGDDVAQQSYDKHDVSDDEMRIEKRATSERTMYVSQARMRVTNNPSARINKSDFNNNNNNNRTTRRRASQVLRLCPETVSKLNVALNQGLEENTDKQQWVRGEPPVSRKHLASGLSPKLHRHYGGSTSVPIKIAERKEDEGKRERNLTLPVNNIMRGRDQYINDPLLGYRHKQDPFIRRTSGSKTPTSPNRNFYPSHRTNEAFHNEPARNATRRYSKDDLNVTKDNPPSGSRWTSAGFITQRPDKIATKEAQKPYGARSERGRKAMQANDGRVPWQTTVKDRPQLPETLV